MKHISAAEGVQRDQCGGDAGAVGLEYGLVLMGAGLIVGVVRAVGQVLFDWYTSFAVLFPGLG